MEAFDIWQRYEKSVKYMDTKGILTRTEKNWLMYSGRQWEAVEDSQGLEDLPMLNFIKPTVQYKVSTVAQHSVSALFSDMNSDNSEIAEKCNLLFDISWEKAKMNRVAWLNLERSAVEGDAYVYWGEGDTRKKPQLIHNTNMKLGDENIDDIQNQPWIIIEERLSAKVLQEKAKANKVPESEYSLIVPDASTDKTLGNKEEVKNKVTSLLYMEKKDGLVWVARCTKNCMYEPFHPIQQKKGGEYFGKGLTRYPIVPMVWEELPNSARGLSEVEPLIPNQLELNKTLARRAVSTKMTAFPRIAVDDTAIVNPEDLDKVGAVIKLNGGQVQSIANLITYLAPQAMSQDAKLLCDELLNETRSLAGASDAQLGNIDLSRVSGTAAQTIRDQQQVPLNSQVQMYQDFVENVALLWFDMWRAYNPQKIEMDGIEVTAKEIDSIEPNVRIDIAEDTTLSKMAAQQELTNLLNGGKITFEEWVEALPEHTSIGKNTLYTILQNRQEKVETGEMQLDEMGNPIPEAPGGVNPGGVSGGSYQAVQASLADRPIME